jgi:hypothetical protein
MQQRRRESNILRCAESHIRLAGCSFDTTTRAENRNIYELKYKTFSDGILKKPEGKAKINLGKCIENSKDRDTKVWNKC